MPDSSITVVDAGPRSVSRRVVVDAPAHELFVLLADPRRHGELDGSGTVLDIVKGPDRLTTGARFSQKMKQFGVPYRITSTVTAVEDDRLVEWAHPLGHRWRWELAELSPGRTQVTETFSYAAAKSPTLLEVTGTPARNAAGIENTLAALRDRFAPGRR